MMALMYTDITVANDGDTEIDAILGTLSFKTSAGGKRIRIDCKGDMQADLGGSAGTYLSKVVEQIPNQLGYSQFRYDGLARNTRL